MQEDLSFIQSIDPCNRNVIHRDIESASPKEDVGHSRKELDACCHVNCREMGKQSKVGSNFGVREWDPHLFWFPNTEVSLSIKNCISVSDSLRGQHPQIRILSNETKTLKKI